MLNMFRFTGMKHHEFYTKYKTNYRPIINPVFSKRNWWQGALITCVAVLFGPLILYKYQRSISLSFDNYLQLIEYCVLLVVPFAAILFWVNWRESTKQKRGYVWLGKFEVIHKRSLLALCYLQLTPGNIKIHVSRNLFEKISVGNFILIRRNSLGTIEEIKKIVNLSNSLSKAKGKVPL